MRVISLSIAATMAFAFAATAQDISSHRHGNSSIDGTRNNGHAENHDWYKQLKQAWYRLLLLQRHGERNRRRLPSDARLPHRRRHVEGADRRALAAGAAASRAAEAGTRRQFTHLRWKERDDLLLHRRLAEELTRTIHTDLL